MRKFRYVPWAVLLIAALLCGGCWSVWHEEYRGPSAKLSPGQPGQQCAPAPGLGGVVDGKVLVPIANVWVDSEGRRHYETVYVVRKGGDGQ